MLFDLCLEIEIGLRVVDQVIQQADAKFAGGDANVFLLMLEDDVVNAAFAGRAGLAAHDLGAGEILDLKCDVLQNVAHPRSFAHPLQEAARSPERAAVVVEGWHELGQALVEAGNLVGWPIFELTDVDDQRITGMRAQMFGPR